MPTSSLLDHRVTVQRQQLTADASGGAVRAFVSLGEIACSIAPAKASVITDYARRDMVVDYQVFTTVDLEQLLPQGLRLGDRLVEGTTLYLVKTVKKSANAAVSSEVVYQVDCEKK